MCVRNQKRDSKLIQNHIASFIYFFFSFLFLLSGWLLAFEVSKEMFLFSLCMREIRIETQRNWNRNRQNDRLKWRVQQQKVWTKMYAAKHSIQVLMRNHIVKGRQRISNWMNVSMAGIKIAWYRTTQFVGKAHFTDTRAIRIPTDTKNSSFEQYTQRIYI